jgi:hypothetical protein
MGDMVKALLFGAFAFAGYMVFQSMDTGTGHPNAPQDAIYYTESSDGAIGLSLFEDEIIMETDTELFSIMLNDVKKAKRTFTKFKVISNDDRFIEFNFISLPEASKFGDLLGERIDEDVYQEYRRTSK